jgi:hypothetical protein
LLGVENKLVVLSEPPCIAANFLCNLPEPVVITPATKRLQDEGNKKPAAADCACRPIQVSPTSPFNDLHQLKLANQGVRVLEGFAIRIALN